MNAYGMGIYQGCAPASAVGQLVIHSRGISDASRMERRDFLEPCAGGCRIWIDASPGADRSKVEGVNRWRMALQVRVGAQAREGEANVELVRFLAERLDVPRRKVSVVKGERSSTKLVEVPLTADEVRRRLGV